MNNSDNSDNTHIAHTPTTSASQDSTPSAYLGIDIAKAKFDVALLRAGKFKSRVFSNDAAGFAALSHWLAHNAVPLPALHACMEATGSYYEALALYLCPQVGSVAVVNAYLIAKYAQATGQRQKTDRQDAALIARYAQRERPAPWQPPSASVRALRDLARRLEALGDLTRQESNRLEVASALVKPSIEAVLRSLAEQTKAIKAQIAQHIDDDPDLRNKAHLMDSIPGVGTATIAQVLAGIPEAVLNDVSKADAFTGLAPAQHESGSSVRKPGRISKQGNSRMRAALFMPAVVAAQHNPVVKAFYERLLNNGKPKKLAIVACMRKLLHLIGGVLKTKKPFDPNYHLIQNA
jgi:transposase